MLDAGAIPASSTNGREQFRQCVNDILTVHQERCKNRKYKRRR